MVFPHHVTMGHVFSVTPNGEHWAVNSRLVGVIYRFKDREVAVDFARKMAGRTPPAKVEVRDSNGNVIEEENY
jgi:FKBP-type peptidyl-prolyl cis-trans isomerase 2